MVYVGVGRGGQPKGCLTHQPQGRVIVGGRGSGQLVLPLVLLVLDVTLARHLTVDLGGQVGCSAVLLWGVLRVPLVPSLTVLAHL